MTTPEACDREKKLCDIWYPSDLGTNPITNTSSGFQHPVVVWANGTGMQTSNYSFYLQHLASWGFIVIASRDQATGSGGTTVDAANYIIRSGKAAGSIFFGKVDGSSVGGSGHSQGGATILRLASDNTAPFKTFVPIHGVGRLLGRLCCGLKEASLKNIGPSTSILFMSGSGDREITVDNQRLYDAAPAQLSKAIGILAGSKHDDVMGKPACDRSSCVNGAYGYLGYATAWFMWKLQGAADVPAAFSAAGGEFNRPSWGAPTSPG